MVNLNSLLARYETMAKLSQQMLDAATQSEWERLVEIEQVRSAIEAELQHQDTGAWRGEPAKKKEQFIHAILSADQQVTALTQSWIGGLQHSIGSIGMEKKLKNAYESP